jgi:hypothetical protein
VLFFLSFRKGCLLRRSPGGLRDNDPGRKVNDDAGTHGDQAEDNPDQPYETRVNVGMFAKSPADPTKNPVLSGAVQPFHVHKMGV